MSWIDKFQELSSLNESERRRLSQHSSVLSVPKDSVVFKPGDKPEHLLLLLEGIVRVQQLSRNGREIVLYRVRSGESCVLTTACLLAFEEYSAHGIAETDVEAVGVPIVLFDELISSSKAFRQFVFTTYSQRITELIHVIEDVTIQRIDVRLADKLLKLSNNEPKIQITHQELSTELGSAREVVSRQLAEFQRREWISQARGSIVLLDTDSLRELVKE